MSGDKKIPGGGKGTSGGKIPAGGNNQPGASRAPGLGKAPGGGKLPAGGGGPLGNASQGVKRAAAVGVDTAAKAAIGSATGGVGAAIYGILPKPTDPKPVREKKKRRLYIAGAASAAAILMAMLGVTVVALSLFTALFGGVGGGGAGGAATAAEKGECRSFSTPRLAISGRGAQAGVLGLPLKEQFITASSGFGSRSDPFGGQDASHGGVDFAGAGIAGTPIFAVADGVVQPVNPDPGGYGNFVVIRHELNGQVVDTLYGHMRDVPMVRAGDHVTAGQQVGVVGSTGRSTGAHLHFGVYPGGYNNGQGTPVDPMPWLSKFKGAGGDAATAGGASAAPGAPAPDDTAPGSSAAGGPEGASPYKITAQARQEQQLNPEQQANVAAIISAARESRLKPPARAAVIAVTLAGQATNFVSQTGEGSRTFGVFAERPLGDTSGETLTNPKKAAEGFFKKLDAYAAEHPVWATQPVADVIVGVMPERASMRTQYPQWEQLAVNAVTGMWHEKAAQKGALQPIVSPTAMDPSCVTGAVNGALATNQVPPQYVDILIKAGATCPEIPPAQIAGVIQQESNWNPNATSASPARGLTQFIDSTWASYGVDSGLGKNGQPESGTTPPDPYNPYDSILASAKYQCSLAQTLKPLIASGQLHGELLDLVSASYNAGAGAVIQYGGIPPYPQTMDYVPKVRANRERFTAPGGGIDNGRQAATLASYETSDFGQRVIAAAKSQIGTPYVFGGGGADGPGPVDGGSVVGFDCSSLVLFAVTQAAGHDVDIGRTTWQQVKHGTPVQKSDLQPGDAIYSENTEHVVIWLGNGKVIEAQQDGVPVGIHDYNLDRAEDIRRFG